MRIGSLVLDNPLILAPMAGFTELPLRRLAKEAGCALVVSEMVSANGLIRRQAKTLELLKSHPAERPLAVQIFGVDAGVMKDAARIVQEEGADVVDLNLGCSVRKVMRQGAGVALMRDPYRLEGILKAVRSAVTIPLTIKLRSGWDPSGREALAAARLAEACGVDAVTIHPRTARQGFSGTADWSLISQLKKSLSIPVIGNGDVRIPDDVPRMLQETGCDAVMVGRAAVGNPWIFEQALDLLQGRPPRPVDRSARIAAVRRYIDYSIEHFGQERALRMLRSRLSWFVRGLPHGARFRAAIARLDSRLAFEEAVQGFFND